MNPSPAPSTRGDPRRFLFLRTFKHLAGGGPTPPLGPLYLAASIRQRFGGRFDLKLMDSGLVGTQQIAEELARFQPDYVGLSSLSCEDDLLHELAGLVRSVRRETCVIAGGPHSMVAGEGLLADLNIDYVVVGEAEVSLTALLDALEDGQDPDALPGVALRRNGEPAAASPAPFIEDLDSLPFPAWDLVDFDAYARFPNWSGVQVEKRHAPLLTSRGCPYGCYFCHNLFGKKIRTRSPQHVLDEMTLLRNEYGIREIHVVDDVFNYDPARAGEICDRIARSKPGFHLAFPNGLRADIMTEELIGKLREAGTYRINYGFETASPRLQKMIGKNLDVPRALETFSRTAASGILTGAYFMFGFPTQTREEILEDIRVAADSDLDAAYFFKATPYPGSRFHSAVEGDRKGAEPVRYADYHFYSTQRSHGGMDARELNNLILLAQKRFYLRARRLWRIFRKSSRKTEFVRNLVTVFSLLVQSYVVRQLEKAKPAEVRS